MSASSFITGRLSITLFAAFILQVPICATKFSTTARTTFNSDIRGPSSTCMYRFAYHCGMCLRGSDATSCRSILQNGRSGSGDTLPFPDTDIYALASRNTPTGGDVLRCSGFLWHLLLDRACTEDLSYPGLAAGGLAAVASRDFSPQGGIFLLDPVILYFGVCHLVSALEES